MSDCYDADYLIRLFDLHKQMIYKIAFNILHNRYDAEDAVQTVFLSIINNFEKISELPRNEIIYYFVAVTKHVSLNIIKKQKKHLFEDIDEHFDICSSDIVDEQALNNVMIEEIEKALMELSDFDYSLLYMYLFMQMKPKEIAEKLDISPKTIRIYIKRARERLIIKLEERGITEDDI